MDRILEALEVLRSLVEADLDPKYSKWKEYWTGHLDTYGLPSFVVGDWYITGFAMEFEPGTKKATSAHWLLKPHHGYARERKFKTLDAAMKAALK